MYKTEGEIVERLFLQGNVQLHDHVKALVEHESSKLYLQALAKMTQNGVINTISSTVKVRILASLQLTKEHRAVTALLNHLEVVEIVRALQILDSPRRIRQIELKITKIETEHPHLIDQNVEVKKALLTRCGNVKGKSALKKKMRRRKIDKLRKELAETQQWFSNVTGDIEANNNSAVQELIISGSVSGALSSKVRKWARGLKPDFLEFIMLTLPMDNWRRLADIVHFAPSDFAVDYFLSFAYGEAASKGTFVRAMQDTLNARPGELVSSFRRLTREHPQIFQMYSFIRTQHQLMKNGTISEILAENIPVSTAIWYLEELAANSSNVPKLVRSRLNAEAWALESTKVTESFGKLLERILRFKSKGWKDLANDMKSAASNRLSQLQEEFSVSEGGSSTVVFGDASSSMQTAIEAATIIATMASIFWNAELSFFHSTRQASPHPRPTTVDQALDVCSKIRATGCTSLAAALMPYYRKKIRIDRIILVTDEEENTKCEGYNFARLLEAYKKQVKKDIELIIIGVGSLYRPFHVTLEKSGIEFKRVEIDKYRPDLTKFDDMLRQVALTTTMTKDDDKERTNNDEEEADFVLL